jgi:hypothetical protein
LCRLGFPFHSIEPTYDAGKDTFELPAGSVPLPLFPIEGILTRFVEVVVPTGQPKPNYPLRYLETSSPGLKGQSGGPIFDTHGTVWAIQSKTQHYPLGFNPEVPGEHAREHQFLNVGWGVHAATIVAAMKEKGISFQQSDY